MSDAGDAKQQAMARRHVNALLQPALTACGFRRKRDCYELELAEQVAGVVCFGVGSVDPVEVYVTVGVRFIELEELASHLQGISGTSDGWTLGTRLCDLNSATTPKRSSVRLTGTDGDSATIAQLVDDIQSYGVPFMQEWADLSKLIEYMKHALNERIRGTCYVTDPATTLPVALATIGRADEGLDVIRRMAFSLEGMKNRGYAYSYLKFAAAYEDFVSGLPDSGPGLQTFNP
jgi:hypothetical protein